MNGRAMGQKRWKASHLADMGQARRWFFCARNARNAMLGVRLEENWMNLMKKFHQNFVTCLLAVPVLLAGTYAHAALGLLVVGCFRRRQEEVG